MQNEMSLVTSAATNRKLIAIPVPVPPLTKQNEFAALRRQIQSVRTIYAGFAPNTTSSADKTFVRR